MKNNVIHDVVDWIEESILCCRKINIHMIAKKSGYSPRHIHNLFKQEVSVTIGNYIRMRRVTQAALLIKFTKKHIFDIAIDLNFSSQQAFCRTFLSYFKCNPLNYRKRSFINTSELYPPYTRVPYLIKYKEEETVFFLDAEEVRYEDGIIGKYDKKAQNMRHEKVILILNHHSSAYIATDFICLDNTKSTVGVVSHIGFNIMNSTESKLKIEKRKYALINFKGAWGEYEKFKRGLYVNSDLVRADGFDIEVFSKTKSSNENIFIFDVKVFIPIV
ncbi:helix-turn-helix domain-containing protein (plasmid) [Klebsiella pneumoniae]|uniref:helix-turn-helix domain-containing protein n=1 Tax=Klebsiella pneumoniae TaxID=573 RepID=UPI00398265E1